jgi:hypothetical protein
MVDLKTTSGVFLTWSAGCTGTERSQTRCTRSRTCTPWRPPCLRSRPRVRSHCRVRNRGTEYVSKSGMKWMSGSTAASQAAVTSNVGAASDVSVRA